MQRYFIDDKFDEITFTQDQIHHIKNVMRMKEGEMVYALYKKRCYIIKILSYNPFNFKIVDEENVDSELPLDITLLYCLPKGDKLDLVIQKATEIGVKRIVLVQSSRCVAKFKKEDFDKKRIRFKKIATEASEQSRRLIVPEIYDIIDYHEIDKYTFDHAYIAYENEKSTNFDTNFSEIKKGQSVGILIGSEGGFSIEEVEYAQKNFYRSVTLGKRILRSETACIYALSVLANFAEGL